MYSCDWRYHRHRQWRSGSAVVWYFSDWLRLSLIHGTTRRVLLEGLKQWAELTHWHVFTFIAFNVFFLYTFLYLWVNNTSAYRKDDCISQMKWAIWVGKPTITLGIVNTVNLNSNYYATTKTKLLRSGLYDYRLNLMCIFIYHTVKHMTRNHHSYVLYTLFN